MVIRGMKDKYGLLPLPQYDEDDGHFGETYAGDGYNLISVINYGDGEGIKGAAVSAWMQLGMEESHTSVREYYFARVVMPKFFGFDRSTQDYSDSSLILSYIMCSIADNRAIVYSDQLGGINSLWCDAVDDEEGRTLEQIYKERREQLNEALKSFNDFYK
jgi:hypothetical protein